MDYDPNSKNPTRSRFLIKIFFNGHAAPELVKKIKLIIKKISVLKKIQIVQKIDNLKICYKHSIVHKISRLFL